MDNQWEEIQSILTDINTLCAKIKGCDNIDDRYTNIVNNSLIPINKKLNEIKSSKIHTNDDKSKKSIATEKACNELGSAKLQLTELYDNYNTEIQLSIAKNENDDMLIYNMSHNSIKYFTDYINASNARIHDMAGNFDMRCHNTKTTLLRYTDIFNTKIKSKSKTNSQRLQTILNWINTENIQYKRLSQNIDFITAEQSRIKGLFEDMTKSVNTSVQNLEDKITTTKEKLNKTNSVNKTDKIKAQIEMYENSITKFNDLTVNVKSDFNAVGKIYETKTNLISGILNTITNDRDNIIKLLNDFKSDIQLFKTGSLESNKVEMSETSKVEMSENISIDKIDVKNINDEEKLNKKVKKVSIKE